MANSTVNKVVLGSETLIDLTDTTATASDVAQGKTLHLASGAKATGTACYAAAPENMGNAVTANGILFGRCNSTSTATEFTATVAGLDALYDGAAVMLRNGVVTSASGFTVNVNGLGAKPVYNNMATGNEATPTNPTRDTTIFNINYTMLLVYDSELVDGGAWICYRGYDGNTNTIGYQLRTNSGNRPMADAAYRYRLYFTSADGSKWVPMNTSTSTDATTARTLNTRAIDPFGPIVYNSTNGTTSSGSRPAVGTLWQQYALTIGYSYVKTLTAWDSVWLKCQPNADGSAVMKDIVQALPTSKDGYIYILLGMAYSTTAMELRSEHPVYWHDGTGIRLWTGAEGGGSTVTVTQSLSSGTQVGSISVDGTATALYAPTPPTASTTAPLMDGTASYGSGTSYARSNHVHPTDTSRQATLVSGTNIKTVNGESLLGSGNITAGGATYTTQAVSIPASAWSGTTATVSAAAVTASNDVIIAPAPASIAAWAAAGVYCSAQGAGTLTFTCTTAPTVAITANVMAFEGGVSVLHSMSGVIGSSSYLDADTAFTPTAGTSYDVHFECSDTSISQGDMTITARNVGGYPTLVANGTTITNGDWYVQFMSGTARLGSAWLYGGETVSLTIYG